MESLVRDKRSKSIGVRFTMHEIRDIEKMIATGEYANSNEVVRDAFRAFRRGRGLIKDD